MESTLAVGVATCVNPQDLFSALQILNQRYPLLKTEILSGHKMISCHCCIRDGSSWHWFSAGCMWIRASNFTVSVMKPRWPPFQPLILLYHNNSLFILRIWYRQNKSLLPVFTILSLMCVHRWRRKPGRLIIFRWRWDWLKRVSAGESAGIDDPAEVASGTLKVLSFRNTRNGLVLPVHIVSRKGMCLNVVLRSASGC